MEGHTQKYHMSDNTDWPKPREAGNPILYIPGNCAASCQTIFRRHNIYRQPESRLMKLSISDDTAMPKNDNISKAPKIFSGLYLYYHDFHFLNCSAITHNALLILISPSIPVMALVLVFSRRHFAPIIHLLSYSPEPAARLSRDRSVCLPDDGE